MNLKAKNLNTTKLNSVKKGALTLMLNGVILVAIYIATVLLLQRDLLFPKPIAAATPPTLPIGTSSIWLGPNSDWEVWFSKPTTINKPFPVVIFTHGNGELIDHWLGTFETLRHAGVGVLLVEYPGYGRSAGNPSERSITKAVVAAFDFAASNSEVDASNIVAFGRSLGGGAACALARERDVAAIILESTFTSVRDLAPSFGAPGALILDPFDNLATLRAVEVPVLVIHGERDSLIPVSHGEALAEAAGVDLVRLPCGHNDCPRPWDWILDFLRAEGIVPTRG